MTRFREVALKRFGDDNNDLQTIHHLGGGNFVRSAGMFSAEPLAGL